MNNSPEIRLLASTNNKRGDLFTRLMKDLFFALGYDNLRLDVHKSGREIDLQGKHRFEPRQVLAECKAHVEKIGGGDLNKFFGALERERKKNAPTPVAGYFVSLGGFTETGVEQEIETGDERLILLNAEKVVTELERSRVIVERAVAAERAGHCAQNAKVLQAWLDGEELLGHHRGYSWAIFYAQGKKRTHFALIHADGTPLDESIAKEIVADDRLCDGNLYALQYLKPPRPSISRLALETKVSESYRQWLGEECGYIHLDGLPADADLSATRLKLERLFVPLKATFLPRPDDSSESKQKIKATVLLIGDIMERAKHLAILAAPGGGKSTLLKRLATAYAFGARRGEILDDLPEREWLPLFLRCRELRDRAHRPIIELLDDIPRHAGMNAEECLTFQESSHAALRAGHALLLVDGLDEISDEGARQIFAGHLRTFIGMFPQAALVVTSREAGFRLVAGVVAGACSQATLAPLDENDVLNLCERWHVEVVGDSDKVRSEAKELGRAIWDNERIRKLAENPLLLTTLLVVKRWIGELPRSRAALYQEAIRVLVRTWNVEGFAPLDEEETLAQLSYVACEMMQQGKQQIGQRALLKLLQSARRELEAELQFARISPQAFTERIEYRSSLLMQTGHEHLEGTLEPIYEFRHLTFQEYLTARGYVEEQYPGRDLGKHLADILESHFEDERWQEVIPLAAVLAGRKAEDLMKRLITACEQVNPKEMEARFRVDHLGNTLYQCIRDEVQITAPTLRRALLEIARNRRESRHDYHDGWVAVILRGKFGTIFQELAEKAYLDGGEEFEEYSGTMERLAMYLCFGNEKPKMSDALAISLRKDLESNDRLSKIRAAMVCMELAYLSRVGSPDPLLQAHFESLIEGLGEMLDPNDLPCALASSWAFAWIGERRLSLNLPKPDLIHSFYRLWRQQNRRVFGRYPAWALAAQRLLPRDTFDNDVWKDCDVFLRESVDLTHYRFQRVAQAALLIGWYRRAPWTDVELAELLGKSIEEPHTDISPTVRQLLGDLGDTGRTVLREFDLKAAERGAKLGAPVGRKS